MWQVPPPRISVDVVAVLIEQAHRDRDAAGGAIEVRAPERAGHLVCPVAIYWDKLCRAQPRDRTCRVLECAHAAGSVRDVHERASAFGSCHAASPFSKNESAMKPSAPAGPCAPAGP